MATALAIPASLSAQATPTVPPNHPVYGFVDRLVAARLVDTVLVGQRSMSRREVGRILAQARRQGSPDRWLAARLEVYTASFPDSGTGRVASLIEADLTATDSPARGIAADANGMIDVALNPLTSNQLGRTTADGSVMAYRAAIASGLTSWLAAGVAERVTHVDPRAGSTRTTSQVEQGYARLLWKNAAVTVGRDHLYFGQAARASLGISLNGRAVDQIRLASDRPFVLPSILRYAGPLHATVALGNLGPRQFFPESRLFAYKVSSRPHARFEIGTGLVEQVGGEGSPPGTFLQKAGDAFPLLDALFLHRNFQFSNKLVFVDIRYAIPGIRGAQFYAEGTFDDFDLRRVRSVFTEDAGYVWGLSTSCLAQCGPLRTAVEYHVTGLRFYTHGAFRNGFTLERNIIGDQLGPRGRGAYGMVDLDASGGSYGLDFAYEDRNGNKYGSTTTTPDDSDFRLVLLEHHPAERRWRTMMTATSGAITSRIRYSLTGGIERVENFGHVDGIWRTNWLGRFAVEYRPTLPFY